MEFEDKAIGIITDTVDEITCISCGCEIDTAGLEPFFRVECPDCSTISAVPAKLGQFLLTKLIGTGGMGGVYEAIDNTLGRKVAIKVMLKSLGSDRQFVESFKREAQSVAKLNHPNIAQIYSFGQEKGQPYIVMELVSGEHLDKMIEEMKRVNPALVMQIGLEIAEGLMAADEAGLLHGDIKPENILLDEKGRAKLVDFGIATVSHQSQPDGIWGTPYYISPEKIRRKKPDARSDIYSLGATLYHAIAGVPPFEGKTPIDVVKARLEHPAEPLHLRCRGIDHKVESIIARMLQVEPARRYPNYSSLISDLRKCSSTLGGKRVISTLRKKKTGKLRVAKGQAPDTGRSASAVGQQMPTQSRVVFQKKTQPPATTTSRRQIRTKRSPAVRTSRSSAAIAGTTAPQQPSAKGKQDPRKKQMVKKKKSKAAVWIFMILLLAGAIGGGIFFLHQKKLQRIETRKEFVLLKKEKEKSAKTYQDIRIAVSNVVFTANKAEAYIEQVSAAVLAVTGSPLDLPEPEGSNIEQASTNKTTEAKSPAEKKTVARKASSAPAPRKKSQSEERGFLSREELDAQRRGDSAPAPKPEAKTTPDAEIIEEETVSMPTEDPRTKTIVPYAQNTVLYARRLIKSSEDAMEIKNMAKNLRKEADKATTSGICADKNKKLTELLTKANELKKASEKYAATAKEKLEKTISIKEEVENEREAENKRREEEERARREEEIRVKAAKEHAALLTNELELVATARKSAMEALPEYEYKNIVKELTTQLADYQTDEGKAALQLTIDQINALQELKDFLIKKINEKPFKWGWGSKLSSARDVIGADDSEIKITGMTKKWGEVSRAQMLKFINHYLAPEQSTRESVAVLSAQNLNAAVYCLLNGGTKQAQDFADTAISYNADIEPKAERLMKTGE